MKKTMERRNFFKKIAGVVTGLGIAPFVIKAKETPQVNDCICPPKVWDNRCKCLNLPMQDYHIASFDEDTNTIHAVKNEFGDPKDYRVVLFKATGEAYEINE